jgi:N-acetylmuramoyl-L-alanine amidase
VSLTLLIDPGHGGMNAGCVGGGLVEKSITLTIARQLRDVARTLGCAVRMTRDDDATLTLSERAEGPPYDLALSLHFDTNPVPTVGTLSAYHLGSPLTHLVGRTIELAAPAWCANPRGVPTLTSPHDWTNRAHNVLSRHKSPAVLVECAFLSNPEHVAKLFTPEGQADIVLALMAGVQTLRTFNQNPEMPLA